MVDEVNMMAAAQQVMVQTVLSPYGGVKTFAAVPSDSGRSFVNKREHHF